MTRLSREEYIKAEGCLKRIEYNKLNILYKRADIISINGIDYSKEQNKTNSISDIVGNSVILLEEDEQLKQSIIENKAVELVKKIIDEDSLYILEHLYEKKDMGKWDIINIKNISEETYKRRKRVLIYAVYGELKKIDPKLTQN